MASSSKKEFDLVWSGAAVGLIAFEIWAIRSKNWDGTFSHWGRRTSKAIFKTDTVPGKLLFLTAWYGFAAWVGYHIAIEEPQNG